MALMATDQAKPRENPKTGLCHAVCCMVRDAGEDDYMGDGNWKKKVWIAFELEQHMKDGRPFMLSDFYTNSLNEKANLRRDLENWFGREMTADELKGGFDLEGLIRQHATINVVMDGEYPDIGSINPPMDGKADLEIVNTEPPEWVQKRINRGLWNAKMLRAGKDPHKETYEEPAPDAPASSTPF